MGRLLALLNLLEYLNGFFHLLTAGDLPFGVFNVVYKPLFLCIVEGLMSTCVAGVTKPYCRNFS